MHQFNKPPFLATRRGEPIVKVTCSRCKASATAAVKTPLIDPAIQEAKALLAKKECKEPEKRIRRVR